MANVARFALRFVVLNQQEIVTTFHVRRSDGFDPYTNDQLAAVATRVAAWWSVDAFDEPAARNSYSEHTVLTSIAFRRVLPTTTEPEEILLSATGNFPNHEDIFIGPYLLPPPVHGHDYAQPLAFRAVPPQCCGLVTLHTDDESRRGRGRMYLPGPPQEIVESDGSYFLGSERFELVRLPHQIGRKLFKHVGTFDDVDTAANMCVYSRTYGIARTVRRMSCFDALATQRRRMLDGTERRTIGVS